MPVNPYLTPGVFKITHVNSYQSDSHAIPGPTASSRKLGEDDYELLWSGPIAGGLFDYTYAMGRTVIWAPKPDRIMKMELRDGRLFPLQALRLPDGQYPFITDEAIKASVANLDAAPFDSPEYRRLAAQWRGYEYYAIARSMYALLDKDNVLYVGGGDRIVAYGDVEPGNPDAAIEKKGELVFDPSRLNKGRGFLFGIAMTFDGYLIAASQDGTVVGCSRDFKRCHYHTLGDEQIWNGIAVDEHGGVYVASNKKLYKLIWTGGGFSDDPSEGAWSVPYELGSFDAERRGGRGTGTTPTLMGTDPDGDRFVVIADGANVNNVVLYWRDEIPEDWVQLPGTQSRRVAGKLPVDFGDPEREDSYSENSILTAGYGAVIANNSLQNGEPMWMDVMLRANEPKNAPYGIQKFEWDPATRHFGVAWVNRETSISNSTPVISTSSQRIYLAGQREGAWTVESIDYATGQTRAIYTLGPSQRFNPVYPVIQLLPNGDPAYPAFAGIVHVKELHEE